MVEEGWDWTIIPSYVDSEFPSFAHIAQRALNASTHVASLVSALEAAVTLSTTLGDAGMQKSATDAKEWEKLALQNVVSACMPCSRYAHVIMKYVKAYAGGPGAPLVKFMDNVAKTFQCTVPLGQTYWTSVTEQAFTSKTCAKACT